MKCDKCFHSRPIVSENGIHCVCTLSSKTATKCLTGENDNFYARRKEKKLMTNADRIRSMSDEELADWHETCPHIDEECTMKGCLECVLEWLQQLCKEEQ